MEAVDEGLLRALHDPLLWEPPVFQGLEAIRKVLETVQAEDAAAAALCEAVLSGPSAAWPERLRKTPGARTAGMVRQLLRRVPALLERRRIDALQATSMAISISNALDPQEHWPDHVLRTRAQALREHAYVLSCMARYPEALEFVERSERAFVQVHMTRSDLARLDEVRASALRMQKWGGGGAAVAGGAIPSPPRIW